MRQCLILILSCLAMVTLSVRGEERRFEFTYELLDTDFPAGKVVEVYVPIPSNTVGQTILTQSVQSTWEGEFGVEETHGNRYYRLRREVGQTKPLEARLSWTLARQPVAAHGAGELAEARRQRALEADSLVPVNHEILQPILKEIHASRSNESSAATARAIYDWVVDNVEYKKIGSGWGNGDTFWACNERYGNCTDFHALFISLARSEGIPAQFEMGFPVPADRPQGVIGGYHCWVHFYLPETGWLPIDASEAAKHPEMRESLYGGNPAERIHFSSGRDLVVSEASRKQPLNYFIYPYAEVAGKPWPGKVNVRFSYRDLSET